MAKKIYTAGAETKRDTGTVVIGGTVEAGDKFWIDVGTGRVLISATTTSTATTAAELQAAAEATDIPQFGEIEWTVNSSTITWLGPENGRPVSQGISVGTSESNDGAADTQTITKTVTRVGTGKYSYTNTANWSGSTLPVNGDDIHFGLSDACPMFDVDGQDSVTPANIYVHASNRSGQSIGLPKYNEDGDYPEYLPTELEIGAAVTWIGVDDGNEVPLVHINTGTTANAIFRILKSDDRDGDGNAPISILANHSGAAAYVGEASVDFAAYPGQSASFATISSTSPNADIRCGADCTFTTGCTMNGGTAEIWSSTPPPAVSLKAGATMIVDGTGGTITSADVDAGCLFDWRRDAMTITTMTLTGTFDATRAPAYGTKTITNFEVFGGATVNDPSKLITVTNGFDLNQCGVQGESVATMNIGENIRITRGTPS